MLCDCLLKDIFGGLYSRKRGFFQEDVGKAAPMQALIYQGRVPWVRRGPRCPDRPLCAVLCPPPRQLGETGSGLV